MMHSNLDKLILWEFSLDHVLENNNICLTDISKINNSVEYKEEEYIDTTGCSIHYNRDIIQLKFVFFKELCNLHYSR